MVEIFCCYPFSDKFLISKHRNQCTVSIPKLQATQDLCGKVNIASQRHNGPLYAPGSISSYLAPHPIIPSESFHLVPLHNTTHHLLSLHSIREVGLSNTSLALAYVGSVWLAI